VSVAIIDSGGANIASLRFALGRLGTETELTRDPGRVRQADRVLLPGVGAAAGAMHRLIDAGLDQVIRTLAQPVLGICLGMQLLLETSAEGGVDCLGVVEGRAELLDATPDVTVPHMGWNRTWRTADCPLLAGIEDGAHFYYVHSFALGPGVQTMATATHGRTFTALVGRGNFFGTQFHPERSGPAGARLLENFLGLDSCK